MQLPSMASMASRPVTALCILSTLALLITRVGFVNDIQDAAIDSAKVDSANADVSPKEVTLWEYKTMKTSKYNGHTGLTVTLSDHELEFAMNRLGAKGWLLVQFSQGLLIFKRAIAHNNANTLQQPIDTHRNVLMAFDAHHKTSFDRAKRIMQRVLNEAAERGALAGITIVLSVHPEHTASNVANSGCSYWRLTCATPGQCTPCTDPVSWRTPCTRDSDTSGFVSSKECDHVPKVRIIASYWQLSPNGSRYTSADVKLTPAPGNVATEEQLMMFLKRRNPIVKVETQTRATTTTTTTTITTLKRNAWYFDAMLLARFIAMLRQDGVNIRCQWSPYISANTLAGCTIAFANNLPTSAFQIA